MERIFGQYREQCGKKKLLLNYEYMSMTENNTEAELLEHYGVISYKVK